MPESGIIKCGNPSCTFKITQEKMLSITGDQNKQALARPDHFEEAPQDLQKVERCSFCHTNHPSDQSCDGFGY